MTTLNDVYVCAASEDISRAIRWMERLRDAGFNVVSTWPSVVEAIGEANPRTATREQRREWSLGDLEQVDSAGIVWFLVHETEKARGAYFELGYAVGVGGKVLVASGDSMQSIFLGLAHEFDNDLDAFTAIVRMARDQAARDLERTRSAARVIGGVP